MVRWMLTAAALMASHTASLGPHAKFNMSITRLDGAPFFRTDGTSRWPGAVQLSEQPELLLLPNFLDEKTVAAILRLHAEADLKSYERLHSHHYALSE
eukprot:SAG31_NODE_4600_length_3104_cov_2.174709_2_plen_98_part_00